MHHICSFFTDQSYQSNEPNWLHTVWGTQLAPSGWQENNQDCHTHLQLITDFIFISRSFLAKNLTNFEPPQSRKSIPRLTLMWNLSADSHPIEIIHNKARHNMIDANTVRWCSDQLDGAVVGSFLGTPWSNKSDAQPPEEDNSRNLLF